MALREKVIRCIEKFQWDKWLIIIAIMDDLDDDEGEKEWMRISWRRRQDWAHKEALKRIWKGEGVKW